MPGVNEDPLKILYIGWANHVHFQRWVEYFAQAGHRIWILPTTRQPEHPIAGVRALPFITRARRTGLQKLELKLHASLRRFDLVHVHWAGFGYLPFIAGLKPYVVTVWGSDVYQIHEQDAPTRRRVSEGLRHADLVTVDSHDLKRAVEALGVRSEAIRVIQWGVDTAQFTPEAASKPLKARLGIGNGPVILSPRNIAPIYHNNLILEAFKSVLEVHPDAVLVQKHYRRLPETLAAYTKAAEDLGVAGSVRLVGDTPYEELPALYAMSDVAVSVPRSDGTPMSVLEAMACGVIPVVSDLPSLREWITDGRNGYLVPVGDADSLAARIIDVLKAGEALQEARRSNRILVMERADHDQNMQMMTECYRQLLQR